MSNTNLKSSRESALPVVWTNDDIHTGKSAELSRQIEFLDRHGIPGVFFVIPENSPGQELYRDEELLGVIESAKKSGHEFYQHGHQHHAFECGVPDMGMFALDPNAYERFDTERAKIDAMHTFEAQVEMLSKGQRIWRKAFGEDSAGFRPGWGAFCTNHYRALAALGFEWVSSRLPCMTSWLWNAGRWDEPIHFREGIPSAPHLLPQGIMEFPIAGDYAFRVPNISAKIDAMVDLGMQEFAVYLERGHPMLIVSHFHGLQFPGSKAPDTPVSKMGTGYAVHEKLIPAMLATGRARFTGMKDVVGKFSGTPAVECGQTGGSP
jgi:peptidoglycan/xylan/chitin deacetylase (PgdA/CDA1 family)